MLPWVLLYGFTALLFNHPTYMKGVRTDIENFTLTETDRNHLPSAEEIARLAVVEANAHPDQSQMITLSEQPGAIFQRQAFGSLSSDEISVSVIIDLDSGKGYLRKRYSESDEPEEGDQLPLEEGLKPALPTDPMAAIQNSVRPLLAEDDLDAQELSMRSLPDVEFDATVGGKPVKLRFEQASSHRGRGSDPSNKETDTAEPKFNGELFLVGANPRDMTARSFLLRLHMAHGYPSQKNSRWFWAIAVDLMFASMVFWGLSGVFMWWQIKRTRVIGFTLLGASAIVALWLAIGMHWQLANG